MCLPKSGLTRSNSANNGRVRAEVGRNGADTGRSPPNSGKVFPDLGGRLTLPGIHRMWAEFGRFGAELDQFGAQTPTRHRMLDALLLPHTMGLHLQRYDTDRSRRVVLSGQRLPILALVVGTAQETEGFPNP